MKKSLILFALPLIMMGCGGGSEKSENSKEETQEESKSEEVSLHKYVEKWNKKSSKPEKYIEDKIDSKWVQLFSIESQPDGIIKTDYKELVEVDGDLVAMCEFKDGMFPKYNFTSIDIKTKEDPFNFKASYKVDDNIITIIKSGKNEKYTVNYASPNLLVYTKSKEKGMYERGIWRNQKTTLSDVQEELQSYFSVLLSSAYYDILNSTQLFEKNENLNADILASNANQKLIEYSLINQSYDVKNDEIYNSLNQLRKDKGKDIEADYITSYDNKIAAINFDPNQASPNYGYSEYFNVINKILPEIFQTITSRKSANVSYESLVQYTENLQKDYNKHYTAYSIFGDGDEYKIKSAARTYIKENLKNPDSFDHVESGIAPTKKGWICQITYRATNGFGGVVTEQKQVALKYDPESELYYGTKSW